MNIVFLCEGKYDLTFIETYISKKYSFFKSDKNSLFLNIDLQNFSKADNQECVLLIDETATHKVCIMSIGGQDQFKSQLNDVIRSIKDYSELNSEDNHIVTFLDIDNKQYEDKYKMLQQILSKNSIDIKDVDTSKKCSLTNFQTVKGFFYNNAEQYKQKLGKEATQSHMFFTPMIIPPNTNGELETLLLNSISKTKQGDLGKDCEVIVEKANEYIDYLKDNLISKNFLNKQGLIPKAKFASVVSAMYPTKMDYHYSKLIVDTYSFWCFSNSSSINQVFRTIDNIVNINGM